MVMQKTKDMWIRTKYRIQEESKKRKYRNKPKYNIRVDQIVLFATKKDNPNIKFDLNTFDKLF